MPRDLAIRLMAPIELGLPLLRVESIRLRPFKSVGRHARQLVHRPNDRCWQ